jgi:lysozyme
VRAQRRRLLTFVGVELAVFALVVVATVLVVRYVWLPHYRPSLHDGETYGVDVSHYQHHIDWPSVAGDHVQFAYIKATEGGDWVDERFGDNWTGARAAGLEVGAYHFFTLCRTGADQAANYLRVVPVAESDLPPAIDLEYPSNCSQRPAREVIQREVSVFLSTVEAAAGRPVLLYVQDEFEDDYQILATFADRPVWHRGLLRRPRDVCWVVWQFSAFASVDGISGGVDMDVMTAAVRSDRSCG